MSTAVASLDAAHAVLVIAEAKSAGIYSGPMPEDEDEQIAIATNLVAHAVTARNAGVKTPIVERIISLAEAPVPLIEDSRDSNAAAAPIEETPASEPEPAAEARTPPWDPPIDENAAQPTSGDEGNGSSPGDKIPDSPAPSSVRAESPIDFAAEAAKTDAHLGRSRITEANQQEYAAKKLSVAKIQKERLPIPPEIDGEPPTLPRDISTMGDVELRRLHGEFHACYSRAAWLYALEEADENAAELIHDDRLNQALKNVRAGNSGLTVTEAKSLAATEQSVCEWRDRMHQHRTTMRLLKTLRDIYESNVSRLSREASMREVERGPRH